MTIVLMLMGNGQMQIGYFFSEEKPYYRTR